MGVGGRIGGGLLVVGFILSFLYRVPFVDFLPFKKWIGAIGMGGERAGNLKIVAIICLLSPLARE